MTKNFMKTSRSNSGQALIIVLLILAVGLTVALSVISRSVTNVRISRQEEESARAFSAAEAGLETALQSGGTEPVSVGAITANIAKTNQGGDVTFNFGGHEYASGEVATVWLVGHNDVTGEPDPSVFFVPTNRIDVCWNVGGAVEITLIYYDDDDLANRYKVTRWAYDTDPTARGNNFSLADSTPGPYCDTLGLAYRARIDPISGGIAAADKIFALRIKPIYNATTQSLGVYSPDSEPFPDQGVCYTSTATVPVSGVTRSVQQCQFYKAPPAIFDYVLYSDGDLTHS